MSSDNKKKLLFVTTSYPRFENDTAGIFFLPLINKLKQEFYVSILAPDDIKATFKDNDKHYFRYTFNRKHQRLAYNKGIPENLAENPLLLILFPAFLASMFLETLYLSAKNNIIISNWLLPTGLVCSIVSLITKKPHIAIDHSAGTHYLNVFPLKKQIFSFILKNTKKIIVVSPNLKEKLLEINENSVNHISTIPLGINLNDMSSTNFHNEEFIEKYRLNKKNFNVLFFGRAAKIKGLDILIKELKNLQNTSLILAGDEKVNFEKYRKLFLDNSVDTVILGKFFDKEKYELFHHVDLIVFPSIKLKNGRSEGSPVTLIEALALGKLVAASNTGGIPYIIEHGVNGFLFNPNNHGELRQIILDITKNKQRYYNVSQEAKNFAEKYNLNNTTKQLIYEIDKALPNERTQKCPDGIKTNFTTMER